MPTVQPRAGPHGLSSDNLKMPWASSVNLSHFLDFFVSNVAHILTEVTHMNLHEAHMNPQEAHVNHYEAHVFIC